MSTPSTSLLAEARLAAIGSVRVILGRRDAPLYFGDDLRALMGSLLGLVVAIAISVLLNALLLSMMNETAPISSFETVASTVITFLGQTAGSYAVFRGLRRFEKFVPYLVADNWVSFYLSIVTAVIGFAGLSLDVTVTIIGLATLVAKVQIARLVGELKVSGIVLLVVAQLFGAAMALLAIGTLFGPTVAPA